MINSKRICGVCLLLLAVIAGCKEAKPPIVVKNSGPSYEVFAVSYPLAFLTEQIAGPDIKVSVPFSSNENPRSTRPSRDEISKMQEADLLIANGTGATYANWLDTVSLPDSKIVNTASRGLSLREYIAIENVSLVHSHGPEGEHSHPIMAARPWLDPALAKKQANYIEKQLAKVYPEKADQFSANLKTLRDQLDRLSKMLEQVKEKDLSAVMSINAKFKFLSRAAGLDETTLFGLEDESQPIKPWKELKPKIEKQLSDFDEGKPEFILIDAGASRDIEPAKSILAMGFKPIALDPIDSPGASKDSYLVRLENNVRAIANAFGVELTSEK